MENSYLLKILIGRINPLKLYLRETYKVNELYKKIVEDYSNFYIFLGPSVEVFEYEEEGFPKTISPLDVWNCNQGYTNLE